jgi:hypothetical protein
MSHNSAMLSSSSAITPLNIPCLIAYKQNETAINTAVIVKKGPNTSLLVPIPDLANR